MKRILLWNLQWWRADSLLFMFYKFHKYGLCIDLFFKKLRHSFFHLVVNLQTWASILEKKISMIHLVSYDKTWPKKRMQFKYVSDGPTDLPTWKNVDITRLKDSEISCFLWNCLDCIDRKALCCVVLRQTGMHMHGVRNHGWNVGTKMQQTIAFMIIGRFCKCRQRKKNQWLMTP